MSRRASGKELVSLTLHLHSRKSLSTLFPAGEMATLAYLGAPYRTIR